MVLFDNEPHQTLAVNWCQEDSEHAIHPRLVIQYDARIFRNQWAYADVDDGCMRVALCS